MRKDFLGNGGIFSSIYRKYGTLENHVIFSASSVYQSLDNNFNPQNILDWKNLTHGFYSGPTSELKYDTLQIDFKEPFTLSHIKH